mgnify:FL=1
MEETKSGFSKHIGGIKVEKINNDEYVFYSEVKEINLNSSKMAHGGYLCSIADTGMGNAAHQSSQNKRCVTISFEMKLRL